jgi:hypothetical protein
MEKMFEYDSSHVTSSHGSKAAQLRHDLERRNYLDRKAARVLREDAQRRKMDRTRRIKAVWSVLTRRFRLITSAVLHSPATETDARR